MPTRISSSTGVRLAITLSLSALVIALSVTPGDARPGDTGFGWLVSITPPSLQKLAHLLVYGLLTMAWVWTLERVSRRSLRLLVAAIVPLAQGALLEWWQTLIPGRFGTLVDVLVNAAGVALGFLVSLAIFRTAAVRRDSLSKH